MEKIFMNLTWLATVVVLLVGIIKLPLKKLKEKHKIIYRIIVYSISLILTIIGCYLVQKYILCLPILSFEFALLISGTMSVVSLIYGAYENYGIKDLFKKLIEKIKNIPDIKLATKIEKNIQKLGIDKFCSILGFEVKENGISPFATKSENENITITNDITGEVIEK